MDGKQARRTGNSSPLGLLFDHGCDAFTMGLQSLVIAKSVQAGDKASALICFTSALSSFHFSTLEEYYTGGLFLGPGNGVTDGSAIVIFIFTIMGIVGNDWLLICPIEHVSYADLIVLGVILMNLGTILLCIKGILDH